ncbi:6-bladed beta-propeller [Gaopeijia maritima]|uniref:6-bladed beta-propeller n=1 Tax=Gaopeijia maritima TaxID=3119007 RepID=UPI0032470DDA
MDDSRATFAVADSAGVTVVTSTDPVWGEASPWSLALETEIGLLEGDEEYLFGDPISAVRLPDGRIAVADAQSADIRFYSGSGDYLRRSGMHGEGPGEFMSFSWLEECGGRLMAYDWQQRRLTALDFEGGILSTGPFETPEPGRPPYSSTCLPDGSLLAAGWGDPPPMPAGQDYHFFAQRAEVWRVVPDAAETTTLGTYISSERIMTRGGSGPHPFSRSVVFDGSGDRLYIGGAERLQIEVRDSSGELQRILRGPDSELEIDDDFVAEYTSAHLARRDSLDRLFVEAAEYPMPDRYPAYSRLLADPDGHVWVERFVLPWRVERRWGVFAPTGEFLGHVPVPADFRATDIDRDFITGISTDDLGVDRVRVYRLVRSGNP